jgi:nitrite reductase (NADH) small subunit
MITEAFTISEIALGPLGQIPPGEGRNFEVQGRRIAVFHTRTGEVFATQAECPHRVGPLADGLLGGTTLVCPLHSWKFDLRSGQALYGTCDLITYPVRLSAAGEILLTLGAERE